VYRGRQSPRRSRPGLDLSLCVARGDVGAHDPGDVVAGELLACWPCSSSPSGPSTSRPSASALDVAEPTAVGIRLDVPELYRAVVIRRPSHSVVRSRWGTGNDRLCRREQSSVTTSSRRGRWWVLRRLFNAEGRSVLQTIGGTERGAGAAGEHDHYWTSSLSRSLAVWRHLCRRG